MSIGLIRDCNPESRDPGRFSQSRIPGLAMPKSRDFGIEKIVFFQLKAAYKFFFYKLEKMTSLSHTDSDTPQQGSICRQGRQGFTLAGKPSCDPL